MRKGVLRPEFSKLDIGSFFNTFYQNNQIVIGAETVVSFPMTIFCF